LVVCPLVSGKHNVYMWNLGTERLLLVFVKGCSLRRSANSDQSILTANKNIGSEVVKDQLIN